MLRKIRRPFSLTLFVTTSGTNNYLRNGGGPSGADVDMTVTPSGGVAGQIAAGDMIYSTGAGGCASLNTPGASNANAAKMIGVAIDNYPPPTTPGVTRGAIPGEIIHIAFRRDGEFLFKTTAADTLNPGDTVYLGADAQTVQKAASGSPVGIVCQDQTPAPQIAGAGGSTQIGPTITGGTGVYVCVRIKPALAV